MWQQAAPLHFPRGEQPLMTVQQQKSAPGRRRPAGGGGRGGLNLHHSFLLGRLAPLQKPPRRCLRRSLFTRVRESRLEASGSLYNPV